MDTLNFLLSSFPITFSLPLDVGLCDKKDLLTSNKERFCYNVGWWQFLPFLFLLSYVFFCSLWRCNFRAHVDEYQEHMCYFDLTNVVGSRNTFILFIQNFICLQWISWAYLPTQSISSIGVSSVGSILPSCTGKYYISLGDKFCT